MNILSLFCGDHIDIINKDITQGVLRDRKLFPNSWAFYCKRCNRYLMANINGCEGVSNYLMNENEIINYRKSLIKNGFGHLLPEKNKSNGIKKEVLTAYENPTKPKEIG